MGQEECYEMYVGPFHSELVLVGMRFLAGNFASSCESNLPAHGHIHSGLEAQQACTCYD